MKRIATNEAASMVGEYTGSREEVHRRYKEVIGKVGIIATEAERYRVVSGDDDAARTEKAAHRFIFPAEEDKILTAQPGDNSGHERGVVIENKFASVSMFVEAGVGVELDMTVEPPVLRTYDISPIHGSQPKPLPSELMQAIQ